MHEKIGKCEIQGLAIFFISRNRVVPEDSKKGWKKKLKKNYV